MCTYIILGCGIIIGQLGSFPALTLWLSLGVRWRTMSLCLWGFRKQITKSELLGSCFCDLWSIWALPHQVGVFKGTYYVKPLPWTLFISGFRKDSEGVLRNHCFHIPPLAMWTPVPSAHSPGHHLRWAQGPGSSRYFHGGCAVGCSPGGHSQD